MKLEDRPTKETDAVVALAPDSCGLNELSEAHNRILVLGRRLERERDEAREQRDKLLLACRDVMLMHRDKESPHYNECEVDGEECMWCDGVQQVIAELDAAKERP